MSQTDKFNRAKQLRQEGWTIKQIQAQMKIEFGAELNNRLFKEMNTEGFVPPQRHVAAPRQTRTVRAHIRSGQPMTPKKMADHIFETYADVRKVIVLQSGRLVIFVGNTGDIQRLQHYVSTNHLDALILTSATRSVTFGMNDIVYQRND
jgi:hypothetical protein